MDNSEPSEFKFFPILHSEFNPPHQDCNRSTDPCLDVTNSELPFCQPFLNDFAAVVIGRGMKHCESRWLFQHSIVLPVLAAAQPRLSQSCSVKGCSYYGYGPRMKGTRKVWPVQRDDVR